MKKSLIALAALAAVSAASAQSTVTLSGLVDFSAIGSGKITTQTSSVKTQNTGAQNNFSTGQVSLAGTEDLGGGLTASFVINTGIVSATTSTVFGDRDKNLALTGGFGTVRIGRFIPAAAYGFNTVNPSTYVGSIYSIGQTKAVAEARLGTTTTSFERNDNNIQYTSPTVSGLTLNANYSTTSSDSSILAGEAKTQQTGLSVAYANGPLSVAVGINNRSVDAVGTSTTAVGDKLDADLNWISASYDLGVAKLIAAHVTREDKTTVAAGTVTTGVDIKVTNLGVHVPMGAFTLTAAVYSGKNKVSALSTDDTKLSGNQLSVRYALSKRTFAYALTGTNKIAADSGNTVNATFKETGSALGLVHSF
jgi:predicted porin